MGSPIKMARRVLTPHEGYVLPETKGTFLAVDRTCGGYFVKLEGLKDDRLKVYEDEFNFVIDPSEEI